MTAPARLDVDVAAGARQERIVVLEGRVSDDTGTGTAGNDARRTPGCEPTVRSERGALVVAIMSGGTQPLH